MFLCDRNINPNDYWTNLENVPNEFKIVFIPPVLAFGQIILNILEKSNLFNKFLSSHLFLWKMTVSFLHY